MRMATTETRTPLTKERVVRAAVALADRDGLESLSMRRLADELGAGAMSLYHYVPNKEQLVDEMIDVVFGEIEPPSTDVDWKTALRRRAVSTREALNRHRWAVGLMEGRAKQGPAGVRLRNDVLGCLREAGFSIEMTIQACSVQDAYIYGFALRRWEIDAVAAEFPYLAEVATGNVAQVGYDFARAFEYGLDLILEALESRRDAT